MTARKNILAIQKKQLSLEIDAIRLAIQHNAAKGLEAEFAFSRILNKHLPKKFKLGSGFILNGPKVSKQHDIVIYDDICNSPIFLGDNSGAFLGGSAYGVIETTITKMGTTKLEEDIKKIAHLRKIFMDNKVGFQKVVSCPVVDEIALRQGVGNCLASGYDINNIWPEIKKNISEDAAFIGDANLLSFGVNTEEIKYIIADACQKSKRYVVKEKIIFSGPPPRTYLCALNGSKYKSAASLSWTVKRLTKKYGAHVHGLLVLNEKGNDWLLSTKAYSNYDLEVESKDAFLKFLTNMKCSFQGMLVGKFPAAEFV